MKKCPNCNRTYSDETLNFCLDDGTVLVSASSNATDENIPRQTEEKTAILPSNQVTEAVRFEQDTDDSLEEKATTVKSISPAESSQPQIIKQGVSPIFAYLSVGLLGILVLMGGIGIAYLVNSNSNSDTNSEFAKSNSNDTNDKDNELQLGNERLPISITETDKPTPKKTSKKETKETPKKDIGEKDTPEPKPSPTETDKPTQTPTPEATPKEETGRFYVILGSFKDANNAKKRLMLARSRGLPARIINTSNVPGLRSGLQAVVMGPFSKSAAQKALGRARRVSSDAYVKAG